MTIRLVRKLSCIQDLMIIEECLRAMYLTADGTICQALMTMEYRSWRNNVIRNLMSDTKQHDACTAVEHVDPENIQLLSHLQNSVQAFLNGFKIVYANNICVISQLLPAICEEKMPKPENSASPGNSRQEESTNVFKKHKICRSPPRV
jgi:hypothetical protein